MGPEMLKSLVRIVPLVTAASVFATSAKAEQIGLRCTYSGFLGYNDVQKSSASSEFFIDSASMTYHNGKGEIYDIHAIDLNKITIKKMSNHPYYIDETINRINGEYHYRASSNGKVNSSASGSCVKITYVPITQRKF